MSTPYELRRVEVADADFLRDLYTYPKVIAGTLQQPYPSLDMWRKRLSDLSPNTLSLLAFSGEEALGHVSVWPNTRTRQNFIGQMGIAVKDSWHGKGVGATLLAAAVEQADKWMNLYRLELTVYTDNAAAIALYKKFGFEIEGTLRAYALREGAYVDAYAMARLHPKHPISIRTACAPA